MASTTRKARRERKLPVNQLAILGTSTPILCSLSIFNIILQPYAASPNPLPVLRYFPTYQR
jgi:hypothetical protein